MTVNVSVREQLPGDALVFDNHAYDNSIIGTTLDGRVIYAYDLMVNELMQDEGWEESDAIDWIEYNTLRALSYTSGNTPIVVYLY